MGKKTNHEKDRIFKDIINGNASTDKDKMQAISNITPKGLSQIKNLFKILENKNPEDKIILLNAILFKCNSTSSSDKEILQLKAKSLVRKAQIIFAEHIDNQKLEVREEKIKEALDLLEKANLLNHTEELKLKTKPDSIIEGIMETFGDDKFKGSYQKAFEFAEESILIRKDTLSSHPSSIIKALLAASEIGQSIQDNEIKTKSIQYAKTAYNISIENENYLEAANAIKLQALIFESFGDKELSEHLRNQAGKLLLQATEDTSNQIIVHGKIDTKIILIKKSIQGSVLDPIKEAASAGKWVKGTVAGNYGVSGYLGEFLKAYLKDEEDMETALELCFEAINLGIMSSDTPNPLCAAIFAQEYPKTIANILENHPEYFVDAFILKTSMFNASEYSQKLLGYKIHENDGYNSDFEAAIIPFLLEREQLNSQIFTPIKTEIKNGSWDSKIEEYILKLASKEYLTSLSTIALPGFGGSILGQNLTKIDDVIQITQIIAFKTLIEGIIEEKSDNYAPITSFIKAYPEIVSRIMHNHSEYLDDNKMITDICDQTLTNISDQETNDDTQMTGEIDDASS